MNTPEQDSKIIVDDDWKDQVQKEKEQIRDNVQPDDSSPAAENDPENPPLPPASFSMLVHTLATQSMAALGFLPDPVSGTPNKNLVMAKHFVDTLGVLDEKTKGNLDKDEAELMHETLHQLRMAYVAISNESNEEQTPPAPESTIELP